MSLDPRVIDARNNVEIKRAQLMTSVKFGIGEAKRRLAPDLVADQVWEMTKDKAERAAQDMLVSVKNRPWTFGGIGAGIGLFLARGPIGDAIRAMLDHFGRDEDEEAANAPSKSAPVRSNPVALARQAKRHKHAAKKDAAQPSKTEVVK